MLTGSRNALASVLWRSSDRSQLYRTVGLDTGCSLGIYISIPDLKSIPRRAKLGRSDKTDVRDQSPPSTCRFSIHRHWCCTCEPSAMLRTDHRFGCAALHCQLTVLGCSSLTDGNDTDRWRLDLERDSLALARCAQLLPGNQIPCAIRNCIFCVLGIDTHTTC